MGIVIAGGIVSSMIMTLWLIPCLEFALSKRVSKKAKPGNEVVKEENITTEFHGGEQ
jgi:hypothetical protein